MFTDPQNIWIVFVQYRYAKLLLAIKLEMEKLSRIHPFYTASMQMSNVKTINKATKLSPIDFQWQLTLLHQLHVSYIWYQNNGLHVLQYLVSVVLEMQ